MYDLEGFDTANSGCLSAAKAFLDGWVEYLHLIINEKAGIYGSSCASGLDSYYANAHRADFIWGANWNNNISTSNMACVGSTHWASHQRHKQYAGNQVETWNGVTITIDRDCAYGLAWANQPRLFGLCA